MAAARKAGIWIGLPVLVLVGTYAAFHEYVRAAAFVVQAAGLKALAAATAELEAGASALRSGVDTAALAELRHARPRQPLTVPLAVLADLVARGVPADTAAHFIVRLAAASDEQFVVFQRNVERDIALGAPPISAAAVRMSAPTDHADMDAAPGETPPPSPPS